MPEAVVTSVVSSMIIALLSWGSSQLLAWYKGRNARSQAATLAATGGITAGDQIAGGPYMAPSGYYPPQPFPYPGQLGFYPPPPQAPSVNMSKVVIQIGILQLVVNIMGLLVGFVVEELGVGEGLYVLAIFFFGTLTAAIMFFIFGRGVDRRVRWRHLTYVTLGTIPLTLLVNAVVNISIGNPPFTSAGQFVLAVIVAFCQTFLAMGIGGGIANLLSPKPSQQPAGAPFVAQYAPGNPGFPGYGVPYGYGQPGAPSAPLGYPPPVAGAYPGYPPPYPQATTYPPMPGYPPPAGAQGIPAAPLPYIGYPPPAGAPGYPAAPPTEAPANPIPGGAPATQPPGDPGH